MKRFTLLLLILVVWTGILLAQRFGRGSGGGEGWLPEDAPVRTAREVPTHSVEFPRWTNSPSFVTDAILKPRGLLVHNLQEVPYCYRIYTQLLTQSHILRKK